MQREEKQLETSLEALTQRVMDIKNSIAALIAKMENEYETLNWPTVLDNFALISGQISSLHNLLKSDKTAVLRNYVLIPLVLAVERDNNLERLTENRVLYFNHEVVPNYLRTKCEPSVDDKLHQFQSRASSIPLDTLQKQINILNKVSANMVEMVKTHRETAETESNRKAQQQQTSSINDTASLIAAVTMGRNLRVQKRTPDMGMPPNSSVVMNQGPGPGQGMPDQRTNVPQPGPGAPNINIQINKAPSMIKTNIKPGYHPYNRP